MAYLHDFPLTIPGEFGHSDYIEELIAALPEEVTTCVKNKIKDGKKPSEAVKECWKEYKEKQAQAMAEEVGKKDKEITIIKQELDAKAQEIADLKNPKVEVKKEPEMTVGTVEIKDAYKAKQKEIDNRAFGKR